jgi:hypothetical protein
MTRGRQIRNLQNDRKWRRTALDGLRVFCLASTDCPSWTPVVRGAIVGLFQNGAAVPALCPLGLISGYRNHAEEPQNMPVFRFNSPGFRSITGGYGNVRVANPSAGSASDRDPAALFSNHFNQSTYVMAGIA